MAYDDISPPKKRWQQQNFSTIFLLDANQWCHQSVLVLDQNYPNIYNLGIISDIIDSHLIKITLRDQQLSSVTIDIHQSINKDFPSIIIDNIPPCQDLIINTQVCVRQIKNENFNQFLCGRIRAKHSTRLEFLIDFNKLNSNQENNQDIWFTRQNIRLLIEPWHEELRLHQDNIAIKTMFRPVSIDLLINQQEIAYPTPPIEQKDEDDEEVERELEKNKSSAINKLQGIKKGDIFTIG